MPSLVAAVVPAGAMRAISQPTLPVDADLLLRPWRAEDAAAVVAAFDDPAIQRWHVRRMDSLAEARQWIAGWSATWQAEYDASWAVTSTAEDRVVGQVGLRTVVLAAGGAQLSYWVLPDARAGGVARRATGALTRWTFETLGLHRLSLVHSTANVASCRVAAAAGFHHEGTLRQSLLHTDGWHDVHLHALVRAERRPGPGQRARDGAAPASGRGSGAVESR